MHFFYLDESGDTGRDLNNPEQPVMVLGGVNLRDEGWNRTREEFDGLIRDYLGGPPPSGFELHSCDLLCPEGDGWFAGRPLEDRVGLARRLIQLIEDRKHGVQLIAFDKAKIRDTPCGLALAFNPSRPYLLAIDYMITYINWYVKECLGRSARGMIILDRKEQHHEDIEHIMRNRRSEGPAAHRVKWIVEMSYPVDSRRNPMIQLSDLMVYCARRFLEMEHGYRPDWPDAAIQFYAECYNRIASRIARVGIVERGGRNVQRLNQYLSEVRCVPRGQWRRRYQLN